MPENDLSVSDDASRLPEILRRFLRRFDTREPVSSSSVMLITDCITVSPVSETVSMNTWFIWFCIAEAPFSVTFGAMAFSFAVE